MRFEETKIGPKRTLIVKLGDIKLDHELGLISLVLLPLSHPPSREEGLEKKGPLLSRTAAGWIFFVCLEYIVSVKKWFVFDLKNLLLLNEKLICIITLHALAIDVLRLKLPFSHMNVANQSIFICIH